MESYQFCMIAVFLALLVIFFARRRRMAVVRSRIKKRKKKESLRMNELLLSYVGKNCYVYTFDGAVAMEGTIAAVNGQWMEIETKKGKKLVNSDYVMRIEERPEKKK